MAIATVLSTLTCNYTFIKYSDPVPGQLPRALRSIRIFGGANRATLSGVGDQTVDNNGVPIWTQAGVATRVDESDLKWMLEENESFKAFVNGNNIKILHTDKAVDHDRIKRIVAAEMASGDSHAPMKPGDARFGKVKIKLLDESDNSRL